MFPCVKEITAAVGLVPISPGQQYVCLACLVVYNVAPMPILLCSLAGALAKTQTKGYWGVSADCLFRIPESYRGQWREQRWLHATWALRKTNGIYQDHWEDRVSALSARGSSEIDYWFKSVCGSESKMGHGSHGFVKQQTEKLCLYSL